TRTVPTSTPSHTPRGYLAGGSGVVGKISPRRPQRLGQAGRVTARSLRHVRFPATTRADDGGEHLDEIARPETDGPTGLVHRGDERDRTVGAVRPRGKKHDSRIVRRQPAADILRQPAQVVAS